MLLWLVAIDLAVCRRTACFPLLELAVPVVVLVVESGINSGAENLGLTQENLLDVSMYLSVSDYKWIDDVLCCSSDNCDVGILLLSDWVEGI